MVGLYQGKQQGVALVLFKEIMENFNNSFGSDTNFMLRDGQGQEDKKESYTEEWL